MSAKYPAPGQGHIVINNRINNKENVLLVLTIEFKYVNNAYSHEMTCEIRNYNMLEMKIVYFSLILLHTGNFNNQKDPASLTTASMITKMVPNFHYTTTNKNAIQLFSLYAAI